MTGAVKETETVVESKEVRVIIGQILGLLSNYLCKYLYTNNNITNLNNDLYYF